MTARSPDPLVPERVQESGVSINDLPKLDPLLPYVAPIAPRNEHELARWQDRQTPPVLPTVEAPSPNAWRLTLICCGRHEGLEYFDTWAAGDEFRKSYLDAPGHQRAAVLERNPDMAGPLCSEPAHCGHNGPCTCAPPVYTAPVVIEGRFVCCGKLVIADHAVDCTQRRPDTVFDLGPIAPTRPSKDPLLPYAAGDSQADGFKPEGAYEAALVAQREKPDPFTQSLINYGLACVSRKSANLDDLFARVMQEHRAALKSQAELSIAAAEERLVDRIVSGLPERFGGPQVELRLPVTWGCQFLPRQDHVLAIAPLLTAALRGGA